MSTFRSRPARPPWRKLLFLLAALFAAAAPAPAPALEVSVDGTVAGQRVATTVDSVAAAYYLESYLGSGARSDALHRAIDEALADSPDPADRDALRRLGERFSTDLATLYFVASLADREENRAFAERYRGRLERLAAEPASRSVAPGHRDYLFAFVPGYGYRKNPEVGADFARQRRLMEGLGFSTVLIETDERGTVEANASVVAATLERLAEEHRRIVLVSTSKGGAEAALALGDAPPPRVAERVAAWISIGGLLRGSPYADRVLAGGLRGFFVRSFLFFRGMPAEMVASLGTERRRAAFERLVFPPGLATVQYVGAPLSGQVSADVRRRYELMKAGGPNDGLTLLADELMPGGTAICELGLDHYYRDPRIDEKGLALVLAVLDGLEER